MVPPGYPDTRRRPASDDLSRDGPKAGRRTSRTVPPNRWMGECDCLIGPFTCRRSAETFAGLVAEFGHYECVSRQVVVQHGAWYVEAIGVVEGELV